MAPRDRLCFLSFYLFSILFNRLKMFMAKLNSNPTIVIFFKAKTNLKHIACLNLSNFHF